MTDKVIEEFAARIDDIWQAITRLQDRVEEIGAHVGAHESTIRTDHPHIVRVQGVCGGRPIIEGTRLSVKLIVGWAREGMTAKEIVTLYPELSTIQIADAMAYYEDHPEEIEAEFAEEERYIEVEIPRLQAMIAERRGPTE